MAWRSDRGEASHHVLEKALNVIKAILIAFSVATVICAFIDQPIKIKPVQTDYCWISYRAAARDQFGGIHIIWTKGWGLCSQLDRYEIA